MKILNKISETSVLKYLFFSILVIFALNNQNFSQSLNLDSSFSGGVSDAPAAVFISATQADGKILVGGNFDFANGVKKPFLARLDSDGTIDQTFNVNGSGADNSVYEIKILASGKILIGGTFRTYNGVVKSGLARLNADGSLDTTFNPNGSGISLNGSVESLAVQADGKILLAGRGITSYNGVRMFSVVRVNQDGTLDASFNSPFTEFAYVVQEAVVQTDGKILIAGAFSIGNPVRRNIARLNQDGTLDNTFNPNGNSANGILNALAVQADGKILVGGLFSNFSGSLQSNYARLNKDGSLDQSFGAGSFGGIAELVTDFEIQPNGKILAAGLFRGFENQIFPVARFNADGSIDNSFSAVRPANNFGQSVELQADGKIIVTGSFTRFNNFSRDNVIRYNSDGTIDDSFAPTFKNIGVVEAIAVQADGKILVGGLFGKANGTAVFNIVRFNRDGTIDGNFNSGAGSGASLSSSSNINLDIAVQPDGKILVGGNFDFFNGRESRGIVRLNSDGSVDTSFASPFNTSFPAGLGNFGSVSDIFVQPDGKILLGGFFRADFTPATGLVRLNKDGSLDQKFPVNVGGIVYSIARQPDGKYLIGGIIRRINDDSRNSIVRLNADGSLDTSFNSGSGATGVIQDIEIQTNGKILIGGTFLSYSGTLQNNLARINVDGSLDTTFNVGTGANNTVYKILRQADGKILIGGDFTNYNGNSANKLARINTDGSFDNSFVSGFTNDTRFGIREIVKQADGSILIGGVFDSYNGVARNSLLRLTASSQSKTKFDYDGDGLADISVFRPSSGIWYLNQSTAGFAAVQFGISTDNIAPADFDGDGKTDIAVFRNGIWYLLRSNKGFAQIQFGASGDVPVPADFDGDGAAELAVYRGGVWYSYNLVTNQTNIVQFGLASDKPVIGDFDGDNKNDYAVYRPSNGTWYLLQSKNGFTAIQFGISTDKTVVGDYDGDGRDDLAVFREGIWYVLQSTRGFTSFQFGTATDEPAPADFDGDGKTDAAIFRNGVWYQLNSTRGVQIVPFGTSGDKPIPNAFVR